MANKIVQLTDNGDNLYPLSVMLQPDAEVVTGSWTAASSNASLQAVTQSIPLTKGVWVVYAQTPSQSASMAFTFRPGTDSAIDTTVQNYFSTPTNGTGQGVIIVKVLADTTMVLKTAGSSSVTYTNLDRGWIKAVKVYELFAGTLTYHLDRYARSLGTSGASIISGIMEYSLGIIIGVYSNQAYTAVFDVASAANTTHQMYISASAYCNYKIDSTNESITISNNNGFTALYVVLYK